MIAVARFYADADIATHLTALLRRMGHDVLTAGDAGRRYARDAEQILAAAQAGRVLVTHNRKDFTLLHQAWLLWPSAWGLRSAPEHAGIAIIPQSPHISDARAAEILTELATSGLTLTNTLYEWRPSGWMPVS
jgi:hypothetical protein